MTRVIITGSDTRLGRAVLGALGDDGSFVVLDAAGAPRWQDDPERLRATLTDTETVLHLAPLLPTVEAEPLAALDAATRGTFVLMTAAVEAGVSRIIVGSSLDLFDRLPAHWDVTERWRPRPEPRLDHLCPWLAELSARECTRTSAVTVVCLRFGRVVDTVELQDQPADPRWLHLDDAVSGVRRALAYRRPGWSVFHITAAGSRAKVRLARAADASFGYTPAHDLMAGRESARNAAPRAVSEAHDPLAPTAPVASRLIRRVVMFGAGGPMGAAAADELAAHYQLRLTDARPLAEIAAEGPQPNQNPGSPVPVVLGPPHELLVADVTNPDDVLAACADMDAVINCSVIRVHPVNAFRVNTLGAYNIARAAVAHGIRRVVQTGPQLITLLGDGDYSSDYDIPADAPPRPGRHLYGHSKYLGQEILRVFADYYGLEVPVLLFSNLFALGQGNMHSFYPFSISWPDTGRAIRRALETPTLPTPYEVLHISADLPHGMVTNARAKEVLGWWPLDDLADMWSGL